MLGNYYDVVQNAINGSGSGSSNSYIVQTGDSLSAIAAQFGTTVEYLVAINGISNPNVIYARQVVRF